MNPVDKERLLRMIVRCQKARKRKPKTVKETKLTIGDENVPSNFYVDGHLVHTEYLGKSEQVRECLKQILNGKA